MVKMIMIRHPPYVYMRINVLIDDSNDEQATTLHETGTEELHALGFLTRHLGPVHSLQTPFGVA